MRKSEPPNAKQGRDAQRPGMRGPNQVVVFGERARAAMREAKGLGSAPVEEERGAGRTVPFEEEMKEAAENGEWAEALDFAVQCFFATGEEKAVLVVFIKMFREAEGESLEQRVANWLEKTRDVSEEVIMLYSDDEVLVGDVSRLLLGGWRSAGENIQRAIEEAEGECEDG